MPRPTPALPGPEFSLSAWIGEDGNEADVELLVKVTETPCKTAMAPQALLWGLAILTLDAEDVLSATIDNLLRDGPITEANAVSRINALLAAQEPA